MIPALLGEVNIPLVFRQYQAASLVDWDGSDTHPGFQQLLNAIRALLPQPAPSIASAPIPAAITPQQQYVSNATENVTSSSDSPTSTTHVEASKKLHSYFNSGAWVLVLMLVGALAYFNLFPKDWSEPLEVTRAPLTPPPSSQPPDAQPSDAKLEPVSQPEPTQPATDNAVAAHQPSVESTKIQQDSLLLRSTKPSPTKPETAVQATAPKVVATQKPAPQPAVASTTPSPIAVEPVASLTLLIVTWAMPSDKGVATSARVQDYSTKVSESMTAILQGGQRKPVSVEYFYPTQQEYYRLLKDKDGNSESQALCKTKKLTWLYPHSYPAQNSLVRVTVMN